MAKERISQPEAMLIETSQTKLQREKRMQKKGECPGAVGHLKKVAYTHDGKPGRRQEKFPN